MTAAAITANSAIKKLRSLHRFFATGRTAAIDDCLDCAVCPRADCRKSRRTAAQSSRTRAPQYAACQPRYRWALCLNLCSTRRKARTRTPNISARRTRNIRPTPPLPPPLRLPNRTRPHKLEAHLKAPPNRRRTPALRPRRPCARRAALNRFHRRPPRNRFEAQRNRSARRAYTARGGRRHMARQPARAAPAPAHSISRRRSRTPNKKSARGTLAVGRDIFRNAHRDARSLPLGRVRNVGAPQKLRVPPRVAQLVFGKREKKLRRKVVGDCGEHSVGGSLIRLLVREHAFEERLRAVAFA